MNCDGMFRSSSVVKISKLRRVFSQMMLVTWNFRPFNVLSMSLAYTSMKLDVSSSRYYALSRVSAPPRLHRYQFFLNVFPFIPNNMWRRRWTETQLPRISNTFESSVLFLLWVSVGRPCPCSNISESGLCQLVRRIADEPLKGDHCGAFAADLGLPGDVWETILGSWLFFGIVLPASNLNLAM